MNLIADNLLDNARKFARGEPRVRIESRVIAARRPWQKPRWQLEIRDEGWGFRSEDAARIFQRFVRSRTSAPYAIPGTGLGLYLAASACRAQGLRLEGRSEGPGRGAVFTLTGKVHA
jgi:signal transduction histidine kinase